MRGVWALRGIRDRVRHWNGPQTVAAPNSVRAAGLARIGSEAGMETVAMLYTTWPDAETARAPAMEIAE